MKPVLPPRILVVEDNDTNRQLMVSLLKAFDYITDETVDGEAALAQAGRIKPEIIICNVHLPKLDGYGVVRALKANESLRSIPIVAVTPFALLEDRDRILSVGFDGYVSKPVTPETFVQEIEKYLPPERRVSPGTVPLKITQEHDFFPLDEPAPQDTHAAAGGKNPVADDTPNPSRRREDNKQ